MMNEKPWTPTSQLAVIGAGPIGLEATALATSRGLDVALLERGRVAESLRSWGHLPMFSPFSMNHSEWGAALLSGLALPPEEAILTGRQFRQAYLKPLSQHPSIRTCLQLGVEVREIGKSGLSRKAEIGQKSRLNHPFRLLCKRSGHELIHHSQAVIDASGVFTSPQALGDGNIQAPGEREARRSPGFSSGIPDVTGADRHRYADRSTLLVGCGHSAGNLLEAFSRLPESAPRTRVVWLFRSTSQSPFPRFPQDPLPMRDRLSRLGNRLADNPPEWLTPLGGSWIESIQVLEPGFRVSVGGRTQQRLDVDEIVGVAGFRANNRLYRQLQVHECYATGGPIQLAATLLAGSSDCLAQPETNIEVLRNPEPNFYIVGNKSYGSQNTFLLTHGLIQVRQVVDDLESLLQ